MESPADTHTASLGAEGPAARPKRNPLLVLLSWATWPWLFSIWLVPSFATLGFLPSNPREGWSSVGSLREPAYMSHVIGMPYTFRRVRFGVTLDEQGRTTGAERLWRLGPPPDPRPDTVFTLQITRARTGVWFVTSERTELVVFELGGRRAPELLNDATLRAIREACVADGDSSSDRLIPWLDRVASGRPAWQTDIVWEGVIGSLAVGLSLAASLVCAIRGGYGVRWMRRVRRGRCGRCNYDLASVEGTVCPECGEPFDQSASAHRAAP